MFTRKKGHALKRIARRAVLITSVVAVVVAGLESPASASTNAYYFYAGGEQTGVTATSLSANLSVESPYTDTWAYDHSVAEIAIEDGTGNTIEVGWVTNWNASGNTDTKLFTFAWRNNAELGWGTGTPGSGFVPYCSTSPCTSKQNLDVLLTSGGTPLPSKNFTIQHLSLIHI